MKSKTETGHAKNVANLQKLIEQISVYPQYNPPLEDLEITNLQTLYTEAVAVLNGVEEKRNANKKAIHERKVAFENLKPTCTRIINLLEILSLNEGTLNQAKSLNRQIQGTTKRTKTTEEESDTPVRTISTSRQSFTQQTDNFGILVQLLETIPNYTPNEEELKIDTLKTYLETLLGTTKSVDQTEAELNGKFIERSQILYASSTGLYDRAQNVKKYVKSVYGSTASEYLRISKIEFTNIKSI